MRKKSVNNANDGQRTGRQTAYHRGGQREGSPHYVLLYSDGDNSGDEETISLRTVNHSRSPPRRVEVIQIQVQPEDTLQALSLKYGSTISELKRINNIHKENEIFAHRSIKVPVKPFSLLTETLHQTEEPSGADNSIGELVQIDQQTTSREEQILNLITTPIVPMLPRTDLNSTVLNALYEPSIAAITDSTEILEDGESDKLLSSEVADREREYNMVDTLICPGADWGLSWAQVVCGSLLLGLGGPILYYLVYHFSHSSKLHHPEN